MKAKRHGFFRKLRQGRRGQAMVSYAVVTAALLGGLLTMGMVILPKMLDAYNSFTASMFFAINMPFP